MQPPSPFFREAGAGPSVVCLHASASSSRQWLALMESLAPRFHVLAADSYGAGKSPPWPAARKVSLRDEVALLEPVLARARAPLLLVAHSYGAALALIAALERPDRVHALALYEPTLFGLIDAESPSPNDADGIRAALADTAALFDAGDPVGAGRRFVDYWSGPGAWDQMPEPRQGQVAASISNVRGWGNACFSDPTPLEAFSWLGAPVLYMMGKRSPASSRGVARLLTRVLPRVEVVEFEGLGHMGPVTHPEIVNEAIIRFLKRHRPLHPADLLRAAANPSRADSRDASGGAASAPG
jgi:pimeloyl-ACP methyl ester carboxylesterase